MVQEGLTGMDKAFAACFRRAKEKGELSDSADPAVLAQLASPPFTRSPFAPARERRAENSRQSSMRDRHDGRAAKVTSLSSLLPVRNWH
jgi:hypothetical protein